jgi:hypothetical protein
MNFFRSDISSNKFEGELPNLSNMSAILLLNVSHAGLSGRFPISLSSLPSLSYLDLSGYLLSEIPSFNFSIGFPSLFAFKMTNADLTSVAFICNLSHGLGDVDLSNNRISVVDNCTSVISSLKSLDLSWNPIEEIDVLPAGILEVQLQGCNLTDIPDAVVALAYRSPPNDPFAVQAFSPLQHLDLSLNSLAGLQADGDIPVTCIPPSGTGEWSCEGLLVQSLSTFALLESLRMVNTSATWIPSQWLPSSLSSLLIRGSDRIDLSALINDSYLAHEENSPIFFDLDGQHYQCDSLSLSHSTTSIVQFDPIQYVFRYCRCMAGYFGAVSKVSHCRTCDSVTHGGHGDGINCSSSSTLGILPGFFPQWFDYSFDTSNRSLDSTFLHFSLPCPNSEACHPRAGSCVYAARTGLLQCGDDHVPPEDDWWMCAEGYRDRLCSQCEDNYFRTATLDCDSCVSHFPGFPATSDWLLLPIGILIALAIVLFILLQGFGLFALVAEAAVVGLLVYVAVGEGWLLTVMLLLLLLYTVVEAEAAEALVKSLLFFLQTLAVLAPQSGISLATLVPLPAINFHPIGVDCAPSFRWLQQPEGHTAMMLVLPIVLLALSTCVVVSGFFVKRLPFMRRAIAWWDALRSRLLTPRSIVRSITAQLGMDVVHRLLDIEEDVSEDEKSHGENMHHEHIDHNPSIFVEVLAQVVQTGLFILYAVYFDVADSVLRVFASCDPYDSSFMAPPYSWVPCWLHSSPTTLAYEGIIGLVVYVVGVPVLFAALLVAGRRIGTQASARWFGFLFEGYRDGAAYYYELLYVVRRLLLAGVLALVPEQSLLQPQLVSTVLFTSILVHIAVQPNKRWVENALEILSLSMLMVTYSVATAQDSCGWGEIEDRWDDKLPASIILLVLNALMVCAFLAALGWPYIAALLRSVRRVLRIQESTPPSHSADVDLTRINAHLREDNVRLSAELHLLRRRFLYINQRFRIMARISSSRMAF